MAFAVTIKPSWVKISSAIVFPTSSDLVSTKAKKRCTSCLTSGEGWGIGHIVELDESPERCFSNEF
ncbi:hypothetical protein VI817_008977 [Penicillium citrinum]|nr:hypothetical protein VI817_008977 [Penicillium citrinum]